MKDEVRFLGWVWTRPPLDAESGFRGIDTENQRVEHHIEFPEPPVVVSDSRGNVDSGMTPDRPS